MTSSTTLDMHLKNQKSQVSHLEYLDQILGSIHPVHIERVMEMRETIELTLLQNPESKNQVVAYLSGVSNKLQAIGRESAEVLQRELQM